MNRARFSAADIEAAAKAGLLPPDRLAPLMEFLDARAAVAPAPAPSRFDLSHLLWYAGALVIISAMGLFTTLAFDAMGPLALVATGLVYAAAFTWAGARMWDRPGLRVPAGLMITVAVSMAPMIAYGLFDHFGWWGQGQPGRYGSYYKYVKGSWLPLEVATLAACALALRRFPFPFIVLIAAVALWYMSMDLAPWIAGTEDASWELRRKVSVWFGLATILLAWWVDLRATEADYAFWLHLAGISAFWGGITATSSDSEVAKAIYCLMNIGLLGFAIFMGRRVYAVYGTIGVAIYLGHLAWNVFKDFLLFPPVLTVIGLGIIGAGIWYNRRRPAFLAWIDAHVPAPLARLRPLHARAGHI